MIKLILRLSVTSFLVTSLSSIAFAQTEKSVAGKNAQKAIDACWAISLEDRSSVNTNRQRRGSINTTLCMDDHIIELTKTYLFPDSPELIQETRQNLKEIRNGYQRLYWNLYNSLDDCYKEPFGQMCGTENHTVHAITHARLLEDIILNCYKQIERYEIKPKD